MNYFDLLFSPKGTIKPQPFALIVIAVYLLNLVFSSILNAEVMLRAGVLPLLGIQLALTWIWYSAHARRLRDAGKGTVVAASIAVLYALAVIGFALLLSWASAPVTTGTESESKSSLGMLIVILIVAYAFNTGDFVSIWYLLLAYLLLPAVFSLVVVIYSLVTGARASITPDTPASPPAERPKSPFA